MKYQLYNAALILLSLVCVTVASYAHSTETYIIVQGTVPESSTVVQGAPGAYKVHSTIGNDYWTYDVNDWRNNDIVHHDTERHHNYY